MRQTIPTILVAAAFQFVCLGYAATQGGSGAESIIAERCIECHRVPGHLEEARNPTVAAPDFQAIADDPKTYTTERLARFLRQPHFPMRRVTLSEGDIHRIIDFIRDLRSGRKRVD